MLEEPSEKFAPPVWRFLARLRAMDLKVASENGQLRVSAPPGALTAELRRELTERKLEILDFLREMSAPSEREAPILRPIPRDEPLQLSFAQQRLWMLDQIAPGKSGYHVGFLMRLEGTLSISCLNAAISCLTRRHEALRTSFPTVSGRLVQQIDAPGELQLNLIDLSGLPSPEQREKEALRLASEDGRKPYDLARGPLARWQLYRLAPDLHVLWSGMHHIVTDGWSIRVIRTELAEYYDAAVSHRTPSLKPLPLQYADFAA
ncbi:MAG TPA: condensation domain-containing protein, partial [Terrimicrobiaceae bacterium]